jgi:hypothetical protein
VSAWKTPHRDLSPDHQLPSGEREAIAADPLRWRENSEVRFSVDRLKKHDRVFAFRGPDSDSVGRDAVEAAVRRLVIIATLLQEVASL